MLDGGVLAVPLDIVLATNATAVVVVGDLTVATDLTVTVVDADADSGIRVEGSLQLDGAGALTVLADDADVGVELTLFRADGNISRDEDFLVDARYADGGGERCERLVVEDEVRTERSFGVLLAQDASGCGGGGSGGDPVLVPIVLGVVAGACALCVLTAAVVLAALAGAARYRGHCAWLWRERQRADDSIVRSSVSVRAARA